MSKNKARTQKETPPPEQLIREYERIARNSTIPASEKRGLLANLWETLTGQQEKKDS